jgi:hypothetical protein
MSTNPTQGSTQFLNFSDALNYLRWGELIAFEKARDKIWALEGYLLKQRLSEQQ